MRRVREQSPQDLEQGSLLSVAFQNAGVVEYVLYSNVGDDHYAMMNGLAYDNGSGFVTITLNCGSQLVAHCRMGLSFLFEFRTIIGKWNQSILVPSGRA